MNNNGIGVFPCLVVAIFFADVLERKSDYLIKLVENFFRGVMMFVFWVFNTGFTIMILCFLFHYLKEFIMSIKDKLQSLFE